MKKVFFCVMASLMMAACTSKDGSALSSFVSEVSSGGSSDAEAAEAEAPASEIEVSSTGGIDPKEWQGGQTASVSISRIPRNVAEFKELQKKLGTTPEGCVMLQLVAFEMFGRDKNVGEQCVNLNNTDINVPSVMRRLPDILTRKDDTYVRRHLVATYFDGASPENGFNPTSPYTIKVRTSQVHQYERSNSLKGYVLHLEVYSTGYDTPWRGCEVVKQKGSEYYKVCNSPSMYVQCKEVDFDASEDYKGLN